MSWIKVIGINIFLIFFIMFIVEFNLGRWSDDDYPNQKYLILDKTYIDRSSLGIKPEIITIYPKPNGFRFDKNIDLEKITECLVITLGGSTTQQFILSQDETWSQKLQDELNINNSVMDDSCSGKYLVMNLGMAGHNIADNYWLLRNYIHDAKLKPVAIVVYQGINDWHINLNHETKYIPLRKIKHEIVKDLNHRSFIVSSVRKIVDSFNSVEMSNHPIDNNFNGDGFLFKIKQPQKIAGEFVYEKFNHELIENTSKWGGLRYHTNYIQTFVDFVQKFFPETKLIFITQTKSICDLTEFPNVFGYIKVSNEKVNIPYSKFGAKKSLLNKGVCLRLGLVKSNYVSFDRKNPKVKVIDYAGSFVEGWDESYDYSHKTPNGSELFFNRVRNQLLCAIVGCTSGD